MRELGRGGMGIVCEAIDLALDRRVAVKVLRPEMATAVAAARFQREARILARFRHPNVVTIHHVAEGEGLSYFIMDLVEGETLAARLDRGPLSPEETQRVAHDVLAALGAAHEAGIIHRDVKPSNIFLDRRVMLADFGIARSLLPSEERLTTELVGTPMYMAPEQRSMEELTPATDVYSLGVVLYECLTGRPWKAWQDPGPADWSEVPRRWIPMLQRALAIDPRNRWRDAPAFAAGLPGRHTLESPRRMLSVLWAVGSVAAAGLVLWFYFAGRPTPLSRGIGREALPSSFLAVRAWNRGERHYFQGRWDQAYTAYLEAQARDSSCVACDLRQVELAHWRQRRVDSTRWARLRAGRERFELSTQALIEAMQAPPRQRLGQYMRIVGADKDYWPGKFYLGEELFNRGPLLGHSRREAIDTLQQITLLQPRFMPVWYDLTFAHIAAGDSADAYDGVSQLRLLRPDTGVAQLQRQLAYLAYAFRFTGEGKKVWQELRQELDPLGRLEAAAGPRLLLGLGAPEAAVEFGTIFAEEHRTVRRLRRSGLIAQMFGQMALGRPDPARRVAERLRAEFPGEATEFTRTFPAAMILLDSDPGQEEVAHARDALAVLLRPHRRAHQDARWLSLLAELRLGDRGGAAGNAGPAEPLVTGAARVLMQAMLLADRGEFERALALTDPVVQDLDGWDESEQAALREPERAAENATLLRSGFKVLRARWYRALDLPDEARGELRWHQHFHMVQYPSDALTTAEADWTFGTLASWELATVLDDGTADADVCEAYRLVAKRWAKGEPRYRGRADTARQRLQLLGCDA